MYGRGRSGTRAPTLRQEGPHLRPGHEADRSLHPAHRLRAQAGGASGTRSSCPASPSSWITTASTSTPGCADHYATVFQSHHAERAIRICAALIERVRHAQRLAHPIGIAFDEWNVWYRTRSPGARGRHRGALRPDRRARHRRLPERVHPALPGRPIANFAPARERDRPDLHEPQGAVPADDLPPLRLYAEHTRRWPSTSTSRVRRTTATRQETDRRPGPPRGRPRAVPAPRRHGDLRRRRARVDARRGQPRPRARHGRPRVADAAPAAGSRWPKSTAPTSPPPTPSRPPPRSTSASASSTRRGARIEYTFPAHSVTVLRLSPRALTGSHAGSTVPAPRRRRAVHCAAAPRPTPRPPAHAPPPRALRRGRRGGPARLDQRARARAPSDALESLRGLRPARPRAPGVSTPRPVRVLGARRVPRACRAPRALAPRHARLRLRQEPRVGQLAAEERPDLGPSRRRSETGAARQRGFPRPRAAARRAGGAGSRRQHALDYLWMSGRTLVQSRRHFQKRFDLAERVLPAAPASSRLSGGVPALAPRRSLHAMGGGDRSGPAPVPLVPAHGRRSVGAPRSGAARRGRRRGGRRPGLPGTLARPGRGPSGPPRAARRRAASRGTTLLSPFDSLLWHRERVGPALRLRLPDRGLHAGARSGPRLLHAADLARRPAHRPPRPKAIARRGGWSAGRALRALVRHRRRPPAAPGARRAGRGAGRRRGRAWSLARFTGAGQMDLGRVVRADCAGPWAGRSGRRRTPPRRAPISFPRPGSEPSSRAARPPARGEPAFPVEGDVRQHSVVVRRPSHGAFPARARRGRRGWRRPGRGRARPARVGRSRSVGQRSAGPSPRPGPR